jgi:Zn-finger nucleic acid-binding protein
MNDEEKIILDMSCSGIWIANTALERLMHRHRNDKAIWNEMDGIKQKLHAILMDFEHLKSGRNREKQ